jgi:hypothetical protein
MSHALHAAGDQLPPPANSRIGPPCCASRYSMLASLWTETRRLAWPYTSRPQVFGSLIRQCMKEAHACLAHARAAWPMMCQWSQCHTHRGQMINNDMGHVPSRGMQARIPHMLLTQAPYSSAFYHACDSRSGTSSPRLNKWCCYIFGGSCLMQLCNLTSGASTAWTSSTYSSVILQAVWQHGIPQRSRLSLSRDGLEMARASKSMDSSN